MTGQGTGRAWALTRPAFATKVIAPLGAGQSPDTVELPMKRDPECAGCGEPITDHRRKWFVGALFEVPSKPNAYLCPQKRCSACLYNEKHPSYSPVSWQLMCVGLWRTHRRRRAQVLPRYPLCGPGRPGPVPPNSRPQRSLGRGAHQRGGEEPARGGRQRPGQRSPATARLPPACAWCSRRSTTRCL